MDLSLEKNLENMAAQCLKVAQKMHRSDILKDIKDLWRVLTVDRRVGVNDYFQKAPARRAYIGYYFPMYVAKIAVLLQRLDREGHFEEIRKKPLRVLDLGSGTLTGVAALKFFFKNQPFQAIAVDKSVAPMRLGLDILKEVISQDASREISIRQGNLLGPKNAYMQGAKPNFIFLGHVVNELGEGTRSFQRKVSFLEDLLSDLEPGGMILIVEPATRTATRNLMALRDHFALNEELSILAPCTGAAECPLLKTPTSWCFSELKWQRPPQFKKIDDAIGFEREALKTSFLLITQTPTRPIPLHEARVVSGSMTHGGQLRRYLCTEQGLKTLETKVGSQSSSEVNSIIRGEVLPNVLLKRPDIKIYKEG